MQIDWIKWHIRSALLFNSYAFIQGCHTLSYTAPYCAAALSHLPARTSLLFTNFEISASARN